MMGNINKILNDLNEKLSRFERQYLISIIAKEFSLSYTKEDDFLSYSIQNGVSGEDIYKCAKIAKFI